MASMLMSPPPVSPSTLSVENSDTLVPPRLRKRWIRERAQVLGRSPNPTSMAMDGLTEVGEAEECREEKTGESHGALLYVLILSCGLLICFLLTLSVSVYSAASPASSIPARYRFYCNFAPATVSELFNIGPLPC